MSHPEPDAEDVEEDSLALADPDDYHRSQRLKEIHQARRNVHDTLNKIERYTSDGEHAKQKLHLADAVSLYAQELLPPATNANLDTTLPETLPWEDIEEYTTLLGDGKETDVSYQHHNLVFQKCNQLLAELKPLVEEDENDEWEV